MHFHATLHPGGIHGLAIRLLWPWYRRRARVFLETFGASVEGRVDVRD